MLRDNTNNMSIYIQKYEAIISVNIPLLLTEKELLLLRYLILGKSLSEIARYRNRSLKTISCQKSKLYNKLGI
ncbi:TPA: response regulator transcription factor, partial [Escherichia coli]|nr:response regulator transcription factor [Escherichia coli]